MAVYCSHDFVSSLQLVISVVKYPMFMQSTVNERKGLRMKQWSLNVNQSNVVINVSVEIGKSKTVNVRHFCWWPHQFSWLEILLLTGQNVLPYFNWHFIPDRNCNWSQLDWFARKLYKQELLLLCFHYIMKCPMKKVHLLILLILNS